MVSAPLLTAVDACSTTWRVTRFTRATGDVRRFFAERFAPRFAVRFADRFADRFAAGRLRAEDLRPERLAADLRALPRFFAGDFRLRDDFFLVAILILLIGW